MVGGKWEVCGLTLSWWGREEMISTGKALICNTFTQDHDDIRPKFWPSCGCKDYLYCSEW